MNQTLTIASVSTAMDGGLTAVADISAILSATGLSDRSRLIGGVTVLLHQLRLGLALPLRATADADFGIAPLLLRDGTLVAEIEAGGYRKIAGNRWERTLPRGTTATVDLLIPSYTSRHRENVAVGDLVTTEVPGLADALRRPGISIDLDIVLTDRTTLTTTVVVPDAVATLGLKACARTVRDEERDSEDLWRCLEIAVADGIIVDTFRPDPAFETVRAILHREFSPGGASLATVTRGLTDDARAKRTTRIRALLERLVGVRP